MQMDEMLPLLDDSPEPNCLVAGVLLLGRVLLARAWPVHPGCAQNQKAGEATCVHLQLVLGGRQHGRTSAGEPPNVPCRVLPHAAQLHTTPLHCVLLVMQAI